jgi:hypothetical protein
MLPKDRTPFQTENKNEQVFQSCGGHHAQTLYQYRNQACSVGNPLSGKAIRPIFLKKRGEKPKQPEPVKRKPRGR